LLAVGGIGLALRGPLRTRPVPSDLLMLSDRQYLTLAAVAARVCVPPADAPSADDIGVAKSLDQLFATMHPGDVKEFKQLLDLMDNALGRLLLDGGTSTFTGSSEQEQDQILRDWRYSSLAVRRTGYKALTGLCAATYYGNPLVYKKIGYAGPPNFGNFKPKSEAT
ncbi:MAG TPA: hypothetical protein DCQ06_10080, partial [Myxococcales bacterium]|nr:hypothetical protein [Myxococcales bacterium]